MRLPPRERIGPQGLSVSGRRTLHAASARNDARIVLPRLVALLLVVPIVACAAPGAVADPSPRASVTPAASGLTPDDAARALRTTVTGARPLLIVNGIPPTWRAELKADRSSFVVTYREPGRAKTVTLTLALTNIPLPGAATTQAHPRFHGDDASLYQVADASDLRSERFLLWTESGTWSEPGPPGVPYLFSATGLTDAEFWELAGTIHPNQI